MRVMEGVLGMGAGMLLLATPVAAQVGCGDDEAFDVLDFWVGDWDVRVDGRTVGENRIEKILSECAVMEHWTGSDGSRGKSLFYRVPAEDAWKQVWVTENLNRPGGVKEKLLVERGEDGSTLFRGEIALPDGTTILDQTRLTPNDDGTVRQVIQFSRDDGVTWSTTFDAIYVKRERQSSS